jgi:hypothetical protein
MQVPNPEAIMLFRRPAPIVQILAGIAFLGAGTAVHKGSSRDVLDAVGALVLVVGSARWRRKRRDGRAGQ